MILAKTRLVMTSDCCSMSYNDHNIDVHKLHRNDDEKEVEDDEKYDDLPEDAFYMVGTLEEVREKAKKL